jgi:uncharacterized protein YjbJ (UPF0337 family)
MDWNRVESNWRAIKNRLKEKPGMRTDDLNIPKEQRQHLEGKDSTAIQFAEGSNHEGIDDRYSIKSGTINGSELRPGSFSIQSSR